MAWEWSHSQDAYAALEEHIRSQDREWLEIVYAEWHARRTTVDADEDSFSNGNYQRGLAKAQLKSDEELAEFIYERASEQGLCTNGGHEAWCCPYGCGPHLLTWEKPPE